MPALPEWDLRSSMRQSENRGPRLGGPPRTRARSIGPFKVGEKSRSGDTSGSGGLFGGSWVLIFDEVICGFGRTGDTFGASRFGVTPDLITTAKGLTSGTVPMGAVLAKNEIYDTFMSGPEGAIEFYHGYTYSGHPLAAAAGCAALDVYLGEGLFDRARELEGKLEDALHSLKGEPNVIDVRNFGLIGAVELEPIEGQPTVRAMQIFRDCFDDGVIIRTTGDTLAFSPPLIIEEAQIETAIESVRSALRSRQ